jgi:hypothetical protein
MKTLITIVFSITLLMPCTVSANEFVDRVKTSTITSCQLFNFGALLNKPNFTEPKWEYFVAQSGATVVEFTGKISQRLHDAAVEWVLKNNGPAYLWSVARSNMTSEEYATVLNSNEYKRAGTEEEIYKVVGMYYLERYLWVVGTMSKIQFILKGESVQLGITKNKTWNSKEPLFIFEILCSSLSD